MLHSQLPAFRAISMNPALVAQLAQPAVSPTASRRVQADQAAVNGRSLAGWQPAKRQTRQSALRHRLAGSWSQRLTILALMLALKLPLAKAASGFEVIENDEQIKISSLTLEAVIRKKGYVTGVAAGTFLDKNSGFRDAGFGLDIVDWIMEPGSDEAYRDQLKGDLKYEFNNSYHGRRAKRSIEGPQICTKARELAPRVIRGRDFVAVTMSYKYNIAAPGKQTGSEWSQLLVFPEGKRYFISSDRISTVNASEAMFLRIDMPGHIKHKQGDTFSEIYLSYVDRVPSREFLQDFAPDEKFHYLRGVNPAPKRFIRAYRLRDPKTGGDGPWLAGMTLDPSAVYEAWCHQRGYVCMIEEFGGRPIKAGESFSAAFVVGFFDSLEEMHQVYDQFAGSTGLVANEEGWKLLPESK